MSTTQTTQRHQAEQARFAAAQEAERKRLVTLCNVAAQQLGWKQRGSWDDIKQFHGGHESLTEMEISDLERILDFARSKGWKPTHAKPDGKRSRPLCQEEVARKIRAIWLELHGLGIVRDGAESALCSWAANSRDAKVTTDLALLDAEQLAATLERLKQWRTRELMRGELFCPTCGVAFRPSPKQAAKWPDLACDRHKPGAAYQWRKLG